MRHSVAIIGANYGDEGKGLMTDYICATQDADVVMRFNGGAQAGHTVVSGAKGRHVFHHFGCGTLQGITTHLSIFFVANPILFAQELRELLSMGISPRVTIDPDCWVTTPYDMIVNQIIEDARAGKRHGSCGVGFGETIERCENSSFKLKAKDLYDQKWLRMRLYEICREWAPNRLRQMKLDTEENLARLGEQYIDFFMKDRELFCEWATLLAHHAYRDKCVVFEGAQGLLLDQNNSYAFPHVTRSNTGMKNIALLSDDLGIRSLETIYVTRSYLTRHGAGPFYPECSPEEFNLKDNTNVAHDFQGDQRYSLFTTGSANGLIERMIKDSSEYTRGMSSLKDHRISLAVTHIDQHVDDLVSQMLRCMDFKYASYGPMRADVQTLEIVTSKKHKMGG